VPLTGLAIVIFDARAACVNITADSVAKNNEATGCPGALSGGEQFLLKNSIILLEG
jgi:hypothetical protein